MKQHENISFSLKAKIAFQGLDSDTQNHINNELKKTILDANYLNKYPIISIAGKPLRVLRVELTRVLVQKTDYGIVVIDIILRQEGRNL
ncbi:MAG: hypothetical protein ACHQRM_13780 [Bacteroidia bacterium]